MTHATKFLSGTLDFITFLPTGLTPVRGVDLRIRLICILQARLHAPSRLQPRFVLPLLSLFVSFSFC